MVGRRVLRMGWMMEQDQLWLCTESLRPTQTLTRIWVIEQDKGYMMSHSGPLKP